MFSKIHENTAHTQAHRGAALTSEGEGQSFGHTGCRSQSLGSQDGCRGYPLIGPTPHFPDLSVYTAAWCTQAQKLPEPHISRGV